MKDVSAVNSMQGPESVFVSELQCHVAWVISLSLGPVFRARK